MKLNKLIFVALMMLFFAPSALLTADFDWMPSFNIQAQADPSGFHAKIAARFNIGDAQITTVLSNFPKPADAYVALRLGEMSGKPIDYVTRQYKESKGRGWGALAKSLGVRRNSTPSNVVTIFMTNKIKARVREKVKETISKS